MIEIRRLTKEDLPQLHRMHTVVYNMRRDFSKEPNKAEQEYEESLASPVDWCWGTFENSKLLSGLIEQNYLMRFDHNNVKMSGIGGVGTLPEARRGGLIRRIFEKLLPEAYDKGVIFSNLAPFSHDFYRMFGYEIASTRNDLSIPAKNLFNLKPDGEFIHILPGADTTELQQVHAAYISDLNHAICRDYWPNNRAWKRFIEDDPYSTGTFIYLWKDENGIPTSYIKYQDKEDNEGHFMSVLDLAFVDRKGLYGALSLVSGLSAQFKNFCWSMPTFINPFDFCGDAWNVKQQIRPREMTRVINVKAALEKMRFPRGEGEYIIEVEDANLPVNNGKYLVEFGPEGSRVSLTNKEADLRCGVRVLSQLVTGYRTLENTLISRRNDLELIGNQETLHKVFTLRPQHVTEYF